MRKLALVSAAVVVASLALAAPAQAAPAHQLPFPCNQVWAGTTFTTHNPPNAVDLNRSGDDGDAVLASAGGTISRVENEGNTSYGLWIEINHGNGYRSRYAHLSGEWVTLGASVAAGQQIGTVGSSGGSTGPHLHYEQLTNGSAVRVSFNGSQILYWGTANYTSHNVCNPYPGTVNTAGSPLTVRSGTSTSTTAIGSVPDGGTVRITCQTRGQTITGTYGTTSLWDKIGAGYVSDAYVNTGSDGQIAPSC
jgi:peptidase M23-like protein